MTTSYTRYDIYFELKFCTTFGLSDPLIDQLDLDTNTGKNKIQISELIKVCDFALWMVNNIATPTANIYNFV